MHTYIGLVGSPPPPFSPVRSGVTTELKAREEEKKKGNFLRLYFFSIFLRVFEKEEGGGGERVKLEENGAASGPRIGREKSWMSFGGDLVLRSVRFRRDS